MRHFSAPAAWASGAGACHAQVKKSERRRWCAEHLLNARSMAKAADILGQLRQHLVALEVPLRSCGADTAPLRRALLAGLFMHAAVRVPDGEAFAMVAA